MIPASQIDDALIEVMKEGSLTPDNPVFIALNTDANGEPQDYLMGIQCAGIDDKSATILGIVLPAGANEEGPMAQMDIILPTRRSTKFRNFGKAALSLLGEQIHEKNLFATIETEPINSNSLQSF